MVDHMCALFHHGTFWLVAGVTCGQGMLTLPEHLIPPPRHTDLLTVWEVHLTIYMCVRMYVYIYVCVYMYVCVYVYVYINMFVYS